MHDLPLPSRWDDLRVFLAILRHGSFSAAAKALSIEQSTVSRRIAALEDDLGATLFERAATGPTPTRAAERVRALAERIEAEIHDFADVARTVDHGVEGRVRLATSESFGVQVLIPYVLRDLSLRHPGLSVDLILGSGSADLGRREADIALRFYRPQGGDLTARRLARIPLAVLARRDYAQAHEPEPARLDWIAHELPDGTSPDLEFVSGALGVEPRMVTNSHIAQVEAVRAGLGVAWLATSLQTIDPELMVLPLGLPAPPPVELWLVTPRALRKVRRVAAVWSYLEQRLTVLDGAGPVSAIAAR